MSTAPHLGMGLMSTSLAPCWNGTGLGHFVTVAVNSKCLPALLCLENMVSLKSHTTFGPWSLSGCSSPKIPDPHRDG